MHTNIYVVNICKSAVVCFTTAVPTESEDIFPVAMRLGDTPVPIPNTMVKTSAADGTALETVWESRWLPDQKERNRRSCLIKIERALESELCRKQSGTRRFSISPVLTLNQSGRTVIIAGFYQ